MNLNDYNGLRLEKAGAVNIVHRRNKTRCYPTEASGRQRGQTVDRFTIRGVADQAIAMTEEWLARTAPFSIIEARSA